VFLHLWHALNYALLALGLIHAAFRLVSHD